MLTLTTYPTSYNLLRQALFLLEARVPRLDDAYALALMAGVDALSVEVLVRIAEVLAEKGEYGKVEKLLARVDVDLVYAECLELKDINSRFGWALYWDKKEYERVILCIEKDLYWKKSQFRQPDFTARNVDQGTLVPGSHPSTSSNISCESRLSPDWHINYAQALAANGDIHAAVKQVEYAYSVDPNVKDGFSRIGLILHWGKMEYEKVVYWMEKDLQRTVNIYREHTNTSSVVSQQKIFSKTETRSVQRITKHSRLSPEFQINYAKSVAIVKDISHALPVVENLYKNHSEIFNGYGSVAWFYFGKNGNAYEKTIPFFQKDLHLNRLKGGWKVYYAWALALIDQINEANIIIEEAYGEDETVKNGFALCGYMKFFLVNIPQQRHLNGLSMMRHLAD